MEDLWGNALNVRAVFVWVGGVFRWMKNYFSSHFQHAIRHGSEVRWQIASPKYVSKYAYLHFKAIGGIGCFICTPPHQSTGNNA